MAIERKCPKCGARVYQTDDQCMDCGQSLRPGGPPPPPAAHPPPPIESVLPVPQQAAASGRIEPGLTMAVQVGDDGPTIEFPFPDDITATPSVMSELASFLEDPTKEWAISPNEERLIIMLLGQDWAWPQFGEWHKRFQSERYFPANWGGLEYLPDPATPETSDRLRTFARLSDAAKRLLIRMAALTRKTRQTASPYEVARKSDLSPSSLALAMQEIEEAGLGTTDLAIADRLGEMKKDELVALAEKHDVVPGGTKADIAQRLAEQVDGAALITALPPDKREELWVLEPVFADLGDPFLEFELKRIKLLAWDVRTLIAAINTVYRTAQFGGQAEVVVWADPDCPVCKQHLDERISFEQMRSGSIELPPYHPGCDCALRQDVSQAETIDFTVDTSSVPQTVAQQQTGGCACGGTLLLFGILVLAWLIAASAVAVSSG